MTRRLLGSAVALSLAVAVQAADWPQWRGPNRDGHSKDTGLLKEWPESGPPLRWKRTDIGPGYSSPTVAGGRVYIQTTAMGEGFAGDEFALALDEKTGKDVWKTPIGKVGKNEGMHYEGSRSSITVDGDRLYCLSSAGELTCLGTDGKAKWSKNLPGEFGAKLSKWAYSESVLVDGDRVICTPGGPGAGLVALNKTSGELIWKAEIPGNDLADYASVIKLEADGTKQYVQFMRKGVVGVDASSGKFLWRYDGSAGGGKSPANMFTPIVQGNKVFTGSGTGGGLVELKVSGDKVTATEVYLNAAVGAGIGGAVLVDGHLYGTRQGLFCAEFATGTVKWKETAVGNASVCYADGRIYARDHTTGLVVLVEPSPQEYREKGKFKMERPKDERPKAERSVSFGQAWPHPVVANGGLYLRDWNVLACYDVRDPKAGK
jgi:outer membrane protein assembly factor BamB